ncbi:VOC family protein [Rhizobiaceae bacterium BDR2-2]|uniref:VOC family protein n=1 Tax=Ectorhizobium quercum TaxID=2965071 RepID=A0AAE3MW09_9HYPH|nr:VOC family protein [Ectorhizobium quercum]MCX8995914.1 VOC family protein [Ectorhizobium quercum]
MLRVGSIVWGVENVPRAIAFWCAALNYKPLREPAVDWAILVPKEGPGVQLAIDKADVGPSRERPRHHLDLYADDQKKEIARLLSLGASEVEREYPEDADYVVLADPDGNRFCVIQK